MQVFDSNQMFCSKGNQTGQGLTKKTMLGDNRTGLFLQAK